MVMLLWMVAQPSSREMILEREQMRMKGKNRHMNKKSLLSSLGVQAAREARARGLQAALQVL
jgi:hypothetical protein